MSTQSNVLQEPKRRYLERHVVSHADLLNKMLLLIGPQLQLEMAILPAGTGIRLVWDGDVGQCSEMGMRMGTGIKFYPRRLAEQRRENTL